MQLLIAAINVILVMTAVSMTQAKKTKFSDDVLFRAEVDRCTAIAVGPKAGTTGPMTTHTADCADCDFRINKVPAKDWPANSMRTLYQYKGNYPAIITSHRGETWHPDNLEGTPEQIAAWGRESIITGYVPQVAHTYALYEAGYGIMNEHQVAIGESTCAAKLWAAPATAGGKAHIEVREMSQIALERSTTARQAIQVMGDLATTYGFYAADWSGGDMSLGEGGEGLTVVDKTEAWVFHVLADDTGASAVWVAQRLEEDHVAVIANQFVIRHVDPKSDKFMYSSNLWEVAERKGWWKKSDGLLDFLKTYAPQRAHSPYATRRVWRVFNLVAPNTKLNPNTDAYGSDYPFSVKTERRLSPQDIMDIQRDHYEGTEFDLTKGLAAGPYGDPNRFDMAPVDNLTFVEVLQGTYERSISLFRTSYSFVAQSRADVPDALSLLWFSQHAPSGSSYAPFYIGSETVPPQYKRGNLFKYDSNIAFWQFCGVANYAARFYKFAMEDVRKAQAKLMQHSIQASAAVDALVVATLNTAGNQPEAVSKILTEFVHSQATEIVTTWRELLFVLISKYHDGYVAENLDQPSIKMRKMFYPKSWLDATGYWINKPNSGEGVIMFASNAEYISLADSNGRVFSACVFTSFIVAFFSGILFVLFRTTQKTAVTNRTEYMPVVDNL